MEISRCSLCEGCLKPARFNLKTTKTMYSKTTLILIIKNIVNEFKDCNHCTICVHCLDLINELDAIELRRNEIHRQIRTYIQCEKSKCLDNCKKEAEAEITDKLDIDNDTCSYKSCTSNSGSTTIKWLDDFNMQDNISNEKSPVAMTNVHKFIASAQIEKQEIENKCVVNNHLNNEKKDRTIKQSKVAKPYKCHCSKEFRSLWALKNHMRSHSNFKPYICDICGFSFKHQTAFTRHMNTHNGITPFTCVYCNKSFTQKISLTRHNFLHTGEKPYQCDKCGKRFTHHTSFSVHQLSHTGQKSHKCDLCGLAVMSASHLKRHMKVHTGEKKFVCNTCGKPFAERYNLVAHEKLHINRKLVLSTKQSLSRPIKEEIGCLEDDAVCKSEPRTP